MKDKICSIIAIDIYPESGKESPLWKNGMQEWESGETLERMVRALESLNHDVKVVYSPRELTEVYLHLSKDFPFRVSDRKEIEANILVWNLIEGYQSRNREAYIPGICESLGVACTGSDAYAQVISLDKYITKEILYDYIPVVRGESFSLPISEECKQKFEYPCFIKPRWEGSGIGISGKSILHSIEDGNFLDNPEKIVMEDWLWEEYLPGREYTVCMLQVSPGNWQSFPAEVRYPDVVYGEDIKQKDKMPETFIIHLEKETSERLVLYSNKVVQLLRAEGYARLDFKEDKEGNLKFMEINLTPGLSPIYSLYPKIIQEYTDWEYSEILGKIASITWKNFQSQKRYLYGRNQRR